MPYTLNGFGTKYYGKRELAEDGSYITTLWITGLYIPIVPLGSYRVRPMGQGSNWGIHRSQNYQVAKVELCWEQVWHVYMIGAPILLIIGGFAGTEIKKDRAKESLQAQIKSAGTEISAAQTAADKLETDCMNLFKTAGQNAKANDKASVRSDLHDRCAPVAPAIDVYIAKVGKMQALLGQGVASKALDDDERSHYSTYRSLWNIRSHQASETRQIAECLANFSSDCYTGVSPLFDSMEQEDKQACSLLASVNEKCE